MRIGKKAIIIATVCLVVILVAYCVVVLLRSVEVSAPKPRTYLHSVTSTPSRLQWPQVGQSAIGVVGSPYIENHGIQTPTPTASVAKLITALVVLKQKPLALGEQGPLITLSASDVSIYNAYVAEQGSVVPVMAGESLSEYQMLEAMLLPSANNIADSLAIWADGSLAAYSQTANSYLQQVGLINTHVGVDASGYDPSTTSTSHDLVLLGELAMQNPVIAEIVAESNATGIPLTTTIKNVNSLLGTDNIVGIKTGNTNQAGGVFVSASHVSVNGKLVTVVTALAGTPTLAAALSSSAPFIQSTHADFQSEVVVPAGTQLAVYSLPWGGKASVVTTQDLVVTALNASPLSISIHLTSIKAKTSTKQNIGSVSASQSQILSANAVGLRLEQPIPQPNIWWRLLHPRL